MDVGSVSDLGVVPTGKNPKGIVKAKAPALLDLVAELVGDEEDGEEPTLAPVSSKK